MNADMIRILRCIKVDNMSILQANMEYIKANSNQVYATAAAKYGNIRMLQYLIENGSLYSEKTMEMAIKSGKVGTVKYLLTKKCPIKSNTISQASLAILRVLHEASIEIPIGVAHCASMKKDLNKLLFLSGIMQFNEEVFYNAIGDLGTMDFLHHIKCPLDVQNCFRWAINFCDLNTIRWLCNNGYKMNEANLITLLELENEAILRIILKDDYYDKCPIIELSDYMLSFLHDNRYLNYRDHECDVDCTLNNIYYEEYVEDGNDDRLDQMDYMDSIHASDDDNRDQRYHYDCYPFF